MAFLDKNNPACLEVSLGAGLLGAATAVINWRLAAGELDYVINDSGATVLFAGAELLPAVQAIRDRLPRVTEVIVVGGPDDAYEAFLAAAGLPTALLTAAAGRGHRRGSVAGDVQLRHDRTAEGRDAVAPQHRRAHPERGPDSADGAG